MKRDSFSVVRHVGPGYVVESARIGRVRNRVGATRPFSWRWSATVARPSPRLVKRASGRSGTVEGARRALVKAVRRLTDRKHAPPGSDPGRVTADPLVCVSLGGALWTWGARVARSEDALRAVRVASLARAAAVPVALCDAETPDARWVVTLAPSQASKRLEALATGSAPRLLPCGKPVKPTKRQPSPTPHPQARRWYASGVDLHSPRDDSDDDGAWGQ